MSDDKEDAGYVEVWDFAGKVDPAATRTANLNGYSQTSINGYWFIQKATELWGACGTGWGYEILEDRFDEGGPIIDKDTQVPLCKASTHTIKLRLWYMSEDGEEISLVQYGHTPYIYRSQYGYSMDTEAPKKSLMDAIKKSLSMLGFAHDVFLGEWDDPSYVAVRTAEAEINKADDKEEALQAELYKIEDKAKSYLEFMGGSKKIAELEGIHKSAVRWLDALKRSGSKEISTLASKKLALVARGFEKRKSQLEEEK